MTFRISATLAACFLAGGLGLSAPALAQAPAQGKAVSTESVGKPAKGEKACRRRSSTPSRNASNNAFPAWTSPPCA